MQTVISAFDDRQAAQRAVDRLVDAGFDRDDIHIQDDTFTSRATNQSTRLSGGDTDEHRGVLESIGDFFANLFGEDRPSGYSTNYSEAVRRGHSIVVLDLRREEDADRASAILHEVGAFDIDQRAQQWRANEAESPIATDMDSTGQTQTQTQRAGERNLDEQADVLPVVQEELKVGKRAVDRGGVRVIQRVTEQPVRELVKLHEERAFVDRRAVDRPATEEDLTNFREGTIEVRETTEEPVVAKEARVVEEVRVGKQSQDRTETINDTVRRKDVDVQRVEGKGTTGRAELEERAMAANTDSERAMRERTTDERAAEGERAMRERTRDTTSKDSTKDRAEREAKDLPPRDI
jgi:uncharacterized protein (TIGR02271 family)